MNVVCLQHSVQDKEWIRNTKSLRKTQTWRSSDFCIHLVFARVIFFKQLNDVGLCDQNKKCQLTELIALWPRRNDCQCPLHR